MMAKKRKTKREELLIAAKRDLTRAHHDHEKKLNAHAFFKVSNHEVGQDLVQDTFIKTWAYLVKGGKVDLMKPFLYHVLNHLIIDEYRRRKHNTSSLDALREKGFEPSVSPSERTSDIFEGEESLLLLQSLPEKYEKVMKMRYIQDLSIKEIALITGQSRNTVAVQIHRGLIKLKQLHDRT